MKYDVVVVGAGLGGLSVATRLARKGMRTLLLERHAVPGGYSTSFVRGRYEFEVALHELSGIGHECRGGLYRDLERLGVASRVRFLPIHELYRSVFPGVDLVVPVGRAAMEQTLCDAFPSEARGIRRFLERVFTLARELRYFNRGLKGVKPLKVRKAIRYLPARWGEVLARDVSDPRARAVLSQYWGYLGLPPSETSFVYLASALASYAILGPVYVEGRSQALSNAFVAAFEEFGGTVRFQSEVERILVDQGRVTGVRTRTGEVFEAGAVVCNLDPVTTARELVGEEHIPTRWRRRLRFRKASGSTVNVYLGVDAPPERLGLSVHENFVSEDTDFDRHAAAMDELGPPPAVLTTCYNAADPSVSPPGTSMVVLTSLYRGEPWTRLSPGEYVDTKHRIADAMVERAEQIAPGLREHIEVVEVATPITNMRYTRQLAGSIYGFENPGTDHTLLRLRARGPIPGLWFAGAWTQPGGGFQPAINSGAIAAHGVLHEWRNRA